MIQWFVILFLLMTPWLALGNSGTWPSPGTKAWSAGGGGASFSDTFSGTLSNWTMEESTTWAIYSGALGQSQNYVDGFIRYNTPTNTINQHVEYKIIESASNNQYCGVILRNDSGSGWCYIVEVVMYGGVSTTIEWLGYNYTTNTWSTSAYQSVANTTFVNGDVVSFDITGTGTSTQIVIKRNGTVVTTFTNDPTNAADTGKYVGMFSYAYFSGSPAYQFDDFAGGDL